MKKKFAMIAIAGTSIGMFAAVPTASAAHCFEGDSPGFSYFGTDHVKESAHNNEGGPKHAGTSGASNCLETAGNPSSRAPGRN
ncbi:MAG: hypothetical protein ABIP17_09910 [Ilumatobacteraceae bacterium]